MAEEMISKERIDYTIDLLITMAVEEIAEDTGKSPKEIAERLKLENSTISGILERMEKKDLIERRISKEDRRFIQVFATKKGASLEKDVLNAVEEVNEEVMSVFSEDECETLKSHLKLLAGINI